MQQVEASRQNGDGVRVRFWASARAAAGTSELRVTLPEPANVGTVRDLVLAELGGRPGLERVLRVCSVLVGEKPAHDDQVPVARGSTVEFLPPFAGG